MHEYGITQSIINMVCEHIKSSRYKSPGKVTSIKLVIGELSGVIDESINMYFDVLSLQTPCEGARIVFEKRPAMLECKICNKMFKRNPKTFDCPVCGNGLKLTDHGKEFYVESIEVE